MADQTAGKMSGIHIVRAMGQISWLLPPFVARSLFMPERQRIYVVLSRKHGSSAAHIIAQTEGV